MRKVCTQLSGSFLLLAILGAAACSGDESLTIPGTSGTVEVTTATTGAEPDPDGYMVQVDGEAAEPIGPTATLQSTVEPGTHTVQLAGVAPNCTVAENPVTITVAAGETATASFAVTCSATGGGLRVGASTTGSTPDADGYIVTVDGADGGTLGANAEIGIEGLLPGDHAIGLSGIAANCLIQGENPRTVAVVPGVSGSIVFAVVCSEPPAGAGALRITTATTGSEPDQDGYTLVIDGGATQHIGVNTSVSLTNLAAGEHTVRLGGMAQNCVVEGANPVTATVASGATAEVSFAIACSATTGSIRVNVATSGSQVDSDGYIAKLDGKEPGQQVPASGSTTFPGVSAGNHTVALTGVASNCSVSDEPSRSTNVTAGGIAEVSFTVVCSTPEAEWNSISFRVDEFNGQSIWASSPSNIIVSGSYINSIDNTILHYDGRAWGEYFNGGRSSSGALWGISPNEVYAATGRGEVLRWDGTRWSDIGPREDFANFESIWASSGQAIFAGGWFDAIPASGLIEHYNGVAWAAQQSHGFGTNGMVYDMSGLSPTDVYALGTESAFDAPPEEQFTLSGVTHFDGTAWSRSYDTREDFLTAIWANAGNDVFVVTRAGRILHYNGSSWLPMTSPTTQPLLDVWGNSSSNVYAVGRDGVFHYDGARWSNIRETPALRVWGTAREVFVLTTTGVLYRAH